MNSLTEYLEHFRRWMDHNPAGDEHANRWLHFPLLELLRLHLLVTGSPNWHLATVFPGNAEVPCRDRAECSDVERSDENVCREQWRAPERIRGIFSISEHSDQSIRTDLLDLQKIYIIRSHSIFRQSYGIAVTIT